MLKERFELDVANLGKDISLGVVASYTRSYDAWKKIRGVARYLSQEVKKRDDSLAVLDIGCGDGRICCLLNSVNKIREKISFHGIDSSPLEIEFARSLAEFMQMDNLKFNIGDVESLQLEGNFFDVVICLDMVEHLEEPEKCLSKIFKALKPGGMSILATCNDSNPIRTLGKLFKSRIASKSQVHQHEKPIEGFPGHGHVSAKGLRQWVKMVKNQGFIVEGIRRTNIFFGGPRYDKHPIVFAFVLLIDNILDCLPFTSNISERFILKMRKPNEKK